MADKKLTAELYESPSKDKNEEKYGHLSNQCICCMKPMSEDDKTAKSVHMNTDWKAVHTSVEEEDCEKLTGAESQGSFPIGNSCAKKMPKGFVYSPS